MLTSLRIAYHMARSERHLDLSYITLFDGRHALCDYHQRMHTYHGLIAGRLKRRKCAR